MRFFPFLVGLKSMSSTPLTVAILGCGSRGRTYARLLSAQPTRYRITAIADPNPVRLDQVEALNPEQEIRRFSSDEELFAAGKQADILIIATQDHQHYSQSLTALHQNYHLLLEKPAAQTMAEVEEIKRLANEKQRKIALCFVLRYTPFYRKVKELITSGKLGRIMHIEAAEGIGAFHHAHSFVRGHWSKSEDSTPIIIAKCSHDTDILAWLLEESPAQQVSSFGDLSWFRKENAPQGATLRCTDNCPHVGDCRYDAHRYLKEQRRWLDFVYPNQAEQATDAEIIDWLKESPWGRCAWHCDNDVVDHQITSIKFANHATASLILSAFDRGRQLVVHGTEATLRGGEDWDNSEQMRLWLRPLDAPQAEEIILDEIEDGEGYASHGGGDYGLIDSLDSIFSAATSAEQLVQSNLQSHLIGFAAEQSRLQNGTPVSIN